MSKSVQTIGMADGPEHYSNEMGCVTRIFTDPAQNCLKWHVPLKFRGDFRPEDLANFNSTKTYRMDAYGKLLCYAKTQKGTRCNRRAMNRWPRCDHHGGKLHPLDRIDRSDSEKEKSRYQQFKDGLITVDDLDDEELSQCGFRMPNGGIFKPKNVPREVAQAFQRAIFERANEELRSGAVQAAKSLVRLATDSAVDDAVQLRAAQDLLDRSIGKAANVVQVSADQPWQEVFNGIAAISRDESRRIRAIESERVPTKSTIDAEIVDVEQQSSLDDSWEQGESSSETTGSTLSGTDCVEEFNGIGNRTSDKSGEYKSSFDRVARERMYQRNPAILNPTLNYEAPEYNPADFEEKNISGAVEQDGSSPDSTGDYAYLFD